MSRISIPTLAEAPAETHATLEGVTKRLGWTPNLFRLMAVSLNTLTAFVGLSGTLSRTLDVATIESMGLAVSEDSGCKYCAQSHVFLGTWLAKLDTAELELNRRGGSRDPKRAAAVRFASCKTGGLLSAARVCAMGKIRKMAARMLPDRPWPHG